MALRPVLLADRIAREGDQAMEKLAYHRNAPGPFFVEDGCCIECQAPWGEAPDLIAHDDEGDYPHCYFRRQPGTAEELERAVSACSVSCVKAVRYAGDDPGILDRFRAHNAEESCDVLREPS